MNRSESMRKKFLNNLYFDKEEDEDNEAYK